MIAPGDCGSLVRTAMSLALREVIAALTGACDNQAGTQCVTPPHRSNRRGSDCCPRQKRGTIVAK